MEPTAKSYKRGLSKTESFLISSLARQDRTIFTIEDARAILSTDPKRIMHSLIAKKWVLPLKRGLYVIVPLDVGVKGADSFVMHNFVIASLLADPYYIGFWSALNHHGLSDQIPNATFVVTLEARRALKILDSTYQFVRFDKKKFFGLQTIEIDRRAIQISSPEKTIADCLAHPQHCGGLDEIARSVFFSHEELDLSELPDFASRMGNMTILKRLGYILDHSGLLKPYGPLFESFRPTKGYPPLDPLAPRRGKHDSRWGLLINVSIDPERWMY